MFNIAGVSHLETWIENASHARENRVSDPHAVLIIAGERSFLQTANDAAIETFRPFFTPSLPADQGNADVANICPRRPRVQKATGSLKESVRVIPR